MLTLLVVGLCLFGIIRLGSFLNNHPAKAVQATQLLRLLFGK